MPEERVLELLSERYPNIQSASAEITNLSAILALPKGTEFFLSDLHGEHDAFIHMLKSASGVIRSKIEEIFGRDLEEEKRDSLAALIYNPEAEIKRKKNCEGNFDQWCMHSIIRMIDICKSLSTKYSRSKVRKILPKHFAYSMDELLHADDDENKANYYTAIIRSIVECELAEEYIISLADVISKLAVDKLHIIGDIFDRGPHPDMIMDYLESYHDVDFQWGNHDIVWMGAAAGNWSCITNVIRMNISYNNFDMLEIGYGINLRALTSFAKKIYDDDPCEYFKPHILDFNQFDPVSEETAAKMHKAIAICQFKVEGQCIMAHPEYHLENRLLLDKIDFAKGTIDLHGTTYELRDKNFPTVDPKDPYKLTEDEEKLMKTLEAGFRNSEKLQRHIRFMFTHGALYKCYNGNLLFHGCLPMNEDGTFKECTINGETHSGKAYMDFLDSEIRKDFFEPDKVKGYSGDLMWYLWLSKDSPLFGKDQMTTFERCFIADKKTHKEHTVPYYSMIKKQSICRSILDEFGLTQKWSRILNGHVPVKIKDGESPIKGDGLLFIIDGGISKAYQKQTGIAGYTFIFNSRFMALAEHKPYEPLQPDGTQVFHSPVLRPVATLDKRMIIKDTDQAKELEDSIAELKYLISAYRKGIIKETF